MKIRRAKFMQQMLLVILACGMGWSPVMAAGPEGVRARAGELIVRFRPGAAPQAPATVGILAGGARPKFFKAEDLQDQDRPESLKQLERRHGLRAARPLGPGSSTAKTLKGGKPGQDARKAALENVWLLQLDPGLDPETAARAWRADPGVIHAEPNYEGTLAYTPTDPLYTNQRVDYNLVGLEEAWNVRRGADGAVKVAVIDSGLDPSHPDLAPALDRASSFNFIDDNTNVFDDFGHGTRVAGIIGAVGNNGEGIAGVAFGCRLMSLDVVDTSGNVTVADVASAIVWALQHGADVINISLCFRAYSITLDGVCRDAAAVGAVVVAAAGNENQGDWPVYPASFESVIGVGALSHAGTRAAWSNYNGACRTIVDLVAPGETIFSAIPNGQYNGLYSTGTSFAAPIVSGVAGLLKAKYPQQSGAAIVQHLLRTAAPAGPAFQPPDSAGAGLLSARKALETAMAPELEIERVVVDDAIAFGGVNNGDGLFQKGEKARLMIRLKNNRADALNATGVLTTTDPLVSLADPQAVWGTIPCGQMRMTLDGFTSVTLSAASPAHAIAFRLTLTAGASVQKIDFEVRAENFSTPPTIIGSNMTLGRDTTWVIREHTFVMPPARLTVEPGTTVRFDKEGMLEVRGQFDAQGTDKDKITFTSLLGKPEGGFLLPYTYGTGPISREDASLGDADNDGRQEVVFAYASQNSLHFCRWNGVALDVSDVKPVGFSPHSVVIADANNDGLNEVLTADTAGNAIYSLRATDLGLENPVRIADCPAPFWLVVDDVDNDGKNEIIACCYKNGAAKTGFRLYLIRSNAAGYGAAVQLNDLDENYFYDIKVGDANNDGLKELVFLLAGGWDQYGNPAPGHAHVCRISGNILTEIAKAYQLKVIHLEIGDADNDGRNEVIIGHVDGTRFMKMNGTTFSDLANINITKPSWCPVSVADVNEDGRNEVLIGGGPGIYDNIITIYQWNGTNFIANEEILNFSHLPIRIMWGDVNGSGSKDLMIGGWHFASFVIYDPKAIRGSLYPGLWLTTMANSSVMKHCVFQYGPVLDESGGAQFSDCVFERSGAEYCLKSLNGSQPLVRCSAVGNSIGHGIIAGAKALSGCVAEDNRGIGLQGGVMTDCRAERNGSLGIAGWRDGIFNWTTLQPAGAMVASEAIGCRAIDNGRTGIDVKTRALNCVATGNKNRGIDGREVTSCTAANNAWDGISGITVRHSTAVKNGMKGIRTWAADLGNTQSSAEGCLALENGQIGIEVYRQIVNSAAVRNGNGGLKSEDLISGSLAAENAWTGLSALNEAASCVSTANSGHGMERCFSRVRHSWMVANGAYGYYSDGSPFNPNSSRGALERCLVAENRGAGVGRFAALLNSTVRNNRGYGVLSAFSMSGCNIHGNGGASGLDYAETRLSTELMQVNLSGNWWGAVTTGLMNAHPWQTYYNIPAIYDFLDKTKLCEVRYDPHLAAANTGAMPDASAPAFLLAVTPGPDEPVNIGIANFRLTFSKPMNQARPLSVTFGLHAPYTANIVRPAPGWVAPAVWQGSFAVQSDTSDGTRTLRVTGAVDAGGFAIPDDTAHRFVIETSGKPSANNGLAIGQGTKMKLSWEEKNKPSTAIGYNVLRSSDLEGPYLQINGDVVAAPAYLDTGLKPNTVYYYMIYIVDSGMSAMQWTWPFYGETEEDQNSVGDWSRYR